MKNLIIELAKKNKITDIGFCRIEDYNNRINVDNARKGVFSNSTPLAFDPKTAIVFAFGYYVNKKSGNISRYAWGKDYHIVTKQKMRDIVEFLKSYGYHAESYADIGPLDERLLAKLSGVAFIGKNKMAISKTFGSYFFIGYILTDCELEPDCENTLSCMNCGKWVNVCPLGALGEESFDAEKCLSYISQKKGELSDVEIQALSESGKLWGCDLCQEVCPHNANIPETDINEFKTDIITDLQLDDISNKEFKARFGDRAFAWRGKNVLLRNQRYVYIIGSEKKSKKI